MPLLIAVLASAIVHLGAHANLKTTQVRVGDTVIVTLPANASTGYAWSFVSRGSPVLRLVSARYVAPKTTLIGAPGTFVARFVVRSAGRATVSLVYRRATHPPSQPAQRFRTALVARRG